MRRRLLQVCVGMLVPLAWMGTSFFALAFDDVWYRAQFDDRDELAALPPMRIDGELRNVLAAIQGREALNALWYSERETRHLEDVRDLVLVGKGMLVGVLGAATITLGLLTWYAGRRAVYDALLIGACGWCVVGSAVGSLALSQFDAAFVALHRLLFTNDYWLLDPQFEWVVVIFHETAFLRLGITLGLVWLLGLCVLIEVAWLQRRSSELPPVVLRRRRS